MLKQFKVQPSHEDAFIERYDRLMSQALHLTEGDKERAQDLLHDAFIHFTLVRPDLEAVTNLEGYLFVTLRNLRLSQVRRAAHNAQALGSLASYDSLELGLRARDLRTQIQAQDELRLICDYATVRKETSKAGSILILRFFHGYYPSEAAKILRTPRRVVDNWLRLARREAKLYLEDPSSLVFMPRRVAPTLVQESGAKEASVKKKSSPDLAADLRLRIFQSSRGECLSGDLLADLYAPDAGTGVDCAQLAHIVSCETCLDEVNKLLRLPSLAERNPFDVTGRDPRPKGGGGGSGGGPSGGGGFGSGGAGRFARRGRRESKVAFEHRPEELRFSANGFLVGSLKVDSERSEQTISINLDEKISFVEAFSEQGVRLLLMNVEPPPEGSATQSLEVRLSDNRNLRLSLSFGDHWPTLHTVYYDPLLSEASAALDERASEDLGEVLTSAITPVDAQPKRRIREQLRSVVSRVRSFIFDARLWTRPATVTLILAAIFIAALVFMKTGGPVLPPSAADLLAQSIVREEALSAHADQVLHRTFNLEERESSGELIKRQHVDIWSSEAKGITARRLYDEKNQLIAGDWRRRDGVQTIYHHGARPQVQLIPEQRAATPLSFEAVWQSDLSAKEFKSQIGSADKTHVAQTDTTYVIAYEAGNTASVLKATLVLNRSDLRPIEETLLVRQGAETREYRLTETNFERQPLKATPSAVFDPEPELLSSARPETRNSKPETALAPGPQPVTTLVANAALEVEVLRLLNQVGADLGEQVSVTRTAEGRLHIEALVESEKRQREILAALASLKDNPAVKIDVTTVADALKRKPQAVASSAPVVVEGIATSSNTIPVEAELRDFFGRKGYANERLDYQVRQFSTRVVVRSREVLNRAWALRRLAERFSPEQLRALDPDTRAKWLVLARGHATALQQETRMLRQDLSPIFPEASTGEAGDQIEIKSDADFVQAIERLFALCSANEQAINTAFAISPDTEKAAAIKGPQFWHALRGAETLAAKIGARQ